MFKDYIKNQIEKHFDMYLEKKEEALTKAKIAAIDLSVREALVKEAYKFITGEELKKVDYETYYHGMYDRSGTLVTRLHLMVGEGMRDMDLQDTIERATKSIATPIVQNQLDRLKQDKEFIKGVVEEINNYQVSTGVKNEN